MCSFDGFGEVTTSEESQLEDLRVGKLKNRKASGKDKITGEMMKGGGNRVVDWIWSLCNTAFKSVVVPEDWRSTVIAPLYTGKVEMIECKNYRGISLLTVVGKIYVGILVDRVHTVNGGLIDDEQEGFRPGRRCVEKIFTLKQIGKKARQKECRVYVGFIDLEKVHDRVNKEAFWQVLRMYDGGKLLSRIKSMYVDSSACVRVKWGESEQFRIVG